MVYGFVKQSGGHVTIYSEPGLGTTVRIYLPAASSERPRPGGEAAAEEDLPRGSVTVLVVEDDPFVRTLRGRRRSRASAIASSRRSTGATR